MATAHIVSMLEEAVYAHTKYVERCKTLIKRFSHKSSSQLKIEESFTSLARVSRKIEEILTMLSDTATQSPVPAEELETLSAIIFYVYEVSIEEERSLWSKYQILMPSKDVDKHYVRLDRIKILAQKVLEVAEKASGV